MKTLAALLTLASVQAAAWAEMCKGDANCTACANCRSCWYCNKSGKGSCNVLREQADRDAAARKDKRLNPAPPSRMSLLNKPASAEGR